MSAPSQAYVLLLTLLFAVVLGWAVTHPKPKHHAEVPIQADPTGLKLDPNRDDAATLTLLPGVGPGIAENIVRTRQGGAVFRATGDLEAVRYIGPKLIDLIEPWVSYHRQDESGS